MLSSVFEKNKNNEGTQQLYARSGYVNSTDKIIFEHSFFFFFFCIYNDGTENFGSIPTKTYSISGTL